MSQSYDVKKISISCPICNKKKQIDVPEIFKESGNLATISIRAGLICPHSFQVFLDNESKIRGYQKVDFEPNINENIIDISSGVLETEKMLESFVNSDFNILGASLINLNGTPLIKSIFKVKHEKFLFPSSAILYNISKRVAHNLFNGTVKTITLKLEKNLLILSKVNSHILLVVSRPEPNLQLIMIELEDLVEKLSEKW